MNNYIIIIIIIILVFIFSSDKNFINKFIHNKSFILILFIYFIYNNFSFLFLLIGLLGIIFSNENIRKLIFQKYNTQINTGKNYIKKFLNIDEHNQQINKHSKLLQQLIDKNNISDDDENNISNNDENNDINNEENNEDEYNEIEIDLDYNNEYMNTES